MYGWNNACCRTAHDDVTSHPAFHLHSPCIPPARSHAAASHRTHVRRSSSARAAAAADYTNDKDGKDVGAGGHTATTTTTTTTKKRHGDDGGEGSVGRAGAGSGRSLLRVDSRMSASNKPFTALADRRRPPRTVGFAGRGGGGEEELIEEEEAEHTDQDGEEDGYGQEEEEKEEGRAASGLASKAKAFLSDTNTTAASAAAAGSAAAASGAGPRAGPTMAMVREAHAQLQRQKTATGGEGEASGEEEPALRRQDAGADSYMLRIFGTAYTKVAGTDGDEGGGVLKVRACMCVYVCVYVCVCVKCAKCVEGLQAAHQVALTCCPCSAVDGAAASAGRSPAPSFLKSIRDPARLHRSLHDLPTPALPPAAFASCCRCAGVAAPLLQRAHAAGHGVGGGGAPHECGGAAAGERGRRAGADVGSCGLCPAMVGLPRGPRPNTHAHLCSLSHTQTRTHTQRHRHPSVPCFAAHTLSLCSLYTHIHTHMHMRTANLPETANHPHTASCTTPRCVPRWRS